MDDNWPTGRRLSPFLDYYLELVTLESGMTAAEKIAELKDR